MKRSGFTMIELIFVIVILRYFGSSCHSKTWQQHVMMLKLQQKYKKCTAVVSDLGSYYTAHGAFAKVSDMTNVQLVQMQLLQYIECDC